VNVLLFDGNDTIVRFPDRIVKDGFVLQLLPPFSVFENGGRPGRGSIFALFLMNPLSSRNTRFIHLNGRPFVCASLRIWIAQLGAADPDLYTIVLTHYSADAIMVSLPFETTYLGLHL